MSIKCVYHYDIEAIMDCELCGDPVCLNDSFLFFDNNNKTEKKHHLCTVCFYRQQSKSAINELYIAPFIAIIGVILLLKNFFTANFPDLPIIEFLGSIIFIVAIFMISDQSEKLKHIVKKFLNIKIRQLL